MKILNRLYLSWIYLVFAIGIVGFIVSSIITIHDSFVAYKAFERYNSLSLGVVDPNGDSREQLNSISFNTCVELVVDESGKQWISRNKDYATQWKCIKEIELTEKQGFRVSTYSDEPNVYLSNLWGDTEMANIGYLLNCCLWLIISALIVILSVLLKRWLKYVFYGQ